MVGLLKVKTTYIKALHYGRGKKREKIGHQSN